MTDRPASDGPTGIRHETVCQMSIVAYILATSRIGRRGIDVVIMADRWHGVLLHSIVQVLCQSMRTECRVVYFSPFFVIMNKLL